VKNGPVSKEQPFESQPVAAGPAKVGANSPKLDDETLGVLVTGAAAVLLEIRRTPLTTITNTAAIANQLDLRFPLLAKAIETLLC
jgi:hypothetical protein